MLPILRRWRFLVKNSETEMIYRWREPISAAETPVFWLGGRGLGEGCGHLLL